MFCLIIYVSVVEDQSALRSAFERSSFVVEQHRWCVRKHAINSKRLSYRYWASFVFNDYSRRVITQPTNNNIKVETWITNDIQKCQMIGCWCALSIILVGSTEIAQRTNRQKLIALIQSKIRVSAIISIGWAKLIIISFNSNFDREQTTDLTAVTCVPDRRFKIPSSTLTGSMTPRIMCVSAFIWSKIMILVNSTTSPVFRSLSHSYFSSFSVLISGLSQSILVSWITLEIDYSFNELLNGIINSQVNCVSEIKCFLKRFLSYLVGPWKQGGKSELLDFRSTEVPKSTKRSKSTFSSLVWNLSHLAPCRCFLRSRACDHTGYSAFHTFHLRSRYYCSLKDLHWKYRSRILQRLIVPVVLSSGFPQCANLHHSIPTSSWHLGSPIENMHSLFEQSQASPSYFLRPSTLCSTNVKLCLVRVSQWYLLQRVSADHSLPYSVLLSLSQATNASSRAIRASLHNHRISPRARSLKQMRGILEKRSVQVHRLSVWVFWKGKWGDGAQMQCSNLGKEDVLWVRIELGDFCRRNFSWVQSDLIDTPVELLVRICRYTIETVLRIAERQRIRHTTS